MVPYAVKRTGAEQRRILMAHDDAEAWDELEREEDQDTAELRAAGFRLDPLYVRAWICGDCAAGTMPTAPMLAAWMDTSSAELVELVECPVCGGRELAPDDEWFPGAAYLVEGLATVAERIERLRAAGAALRADLSPESIAATQARCDERARTVSSETCYVKQPWRTLPQRAILMPPVDVGDVDELLRAAPQAGASLLDLQRWIDVIARRARDGEISIELALLAVSLASSERERRPVSI